MNHDRDAGHRLSEHLDAVVTGQATRSHDLEPALVATVERFFAADDTPVPPSGLADHLWEDLMDSVPTMSLVPPSPASRPDHDNSTPPRFWATMRPHNRASALAYLATAALLVLTLIGGLLAVIGPQRLLDPEQRSIIPAITGTPEQALPAGVIADVVLRATIAQLPSSERTHQLALYRVELAPGAAERAGGHANTGVGADLFTVEAGQVTVEAVSPVMVTRAVANSPAAPSLAQPSRVVVLDVGDQVYVPSGVSYRRRNHGLIPASLLGFSIGTIGDTVHTWSLPAGVTYVHGLPYTLPDTFPAAPVEATVHRLTLAPGAELAIRDLPGLELVAVEAGALDLVYAKPRTPATPERAFTIHAGSGAETFGRTPEQAVLANRGSEPLVMLTASVVPAGTGVATP